MLPLMRNCIKSGSGAVPGKAKRQNAFSVYDKNYNYVDYTSERKGTDRETGLWQELEKYYKGRQWTETESEILSTMTRMMESYLNHEEYAGNVREQERIQKSRNRTLPEWRQRKAFR